MNELRIRIGEILLRSRLTKTELARRINAPKSQVTMVCNGHMRPSRNLATRIATELAQDPGQLFQEWEIFDEAAS